MNQNKTSGGRRKKLLAAACIAIIIIILLLLRCCKGGGAEAPAPEQGRFSISDITRTPEPTDAPEHAEPDTITFTGCGVYDITAAAPNIVLENPAVNAVSFVFTLTGKDSGIVIARTGKVPPGKCAYVDVTEYFTEVGEYDVTVNIAAYSSDELLMTSLNQEMTIKIHS